jgi:hypothetical protein
MTQAGGLRASLQSSPPPAQGGNFLGDDDVAALDKGAASDDHLGKPETMSPSSPNDRYGRLREEAAREGMRMLQEERERNREMNELLKTRCSDLEEELTQTREELRSTRDRLGKKVLYSSGSNNNNNNITITLIVIVIGAKKTLTLESARVKKK